MGSKMDDRFMPALRRHAHAGFTLIEVLVAVLVLSIGLLGLAGMQARALQFGQGAYLRSQATLLASDILDRIRANPEAALAGQYDIGLTDAPDSSATCIGAACGTSALASFDTNVWRCSLGNWDDDANCQALNIDGLLPEGKGSIANSNGLITVTVQWHGRDDETVSLVFDTEIEE